MTDAPPSIVSHVSLGTNDLAAATTFYDSVLPTLAIGRKLEHPRAVAYGRAFPEFWIEVPFDGQPASAGNGTHVGFIATSKEQVHAFYEAAIAAGAKSDGEPGPRPEYGTPYYGCFVRDLDGHKIEAAYWDANAA